MAKLHSAEEGLAHAVLNGKPYFGPVMAALQGPPERYRCLDAILKGFALSKKTGSIEVLEIGSWAGASTVTWAIAIQGIGREGRITCVDGWKPYFDLQTDIGDHYSEMDQAARTGDAFRLFLHNIRTTGIEHMIKYVVGDSREILPTLSAEKFDIIYIDGSHAYEVVRSDIRYSKTLVKDNGIVCGDDLELQRREVDKEEHGLLMLCPKDYCLDVRSGQYYHPGVTEAVGLEFEEVTTHEGIWAVQRSGQRWVPAEIDVALGAIPPFIADAFIVKGVGATQSYVLVEAGGQFVAISKSLGPVNLFRETLGERELPPWFLVADTLEEVIAKAEETIAFVELVGESSRYNFLRAGDRFLAVAKTLGPTDVTQEILASREMTPWILAGDTLLEVQSRARLFESFLFRIMARVFFRKPRW